MTWIGRWFMVVLLGMGLSACVGSEKGRGGLAQALSGTVQQAPIPVVPQPPAVTALVDHLTLRSQPGGPFGSGSTARDDGLAAWLSAEPEPEVQGLVSLVPAEGCADVVSQIKAQMLADMNSRVDANLQAALSAASNRCWWRDDYVWDDCDCDSDGVIGGYEPPGPPESGTAGETASEYSTTNTQVEDVDEADFIKNDGGFLYVVANGALRIVDAWPAPEAHVLSVTPIEGEPKKLYVYNQHAVVYSALGGSAAGNDYGVSWSGSTECTYGYDCEFTGDGQPLKITVLDLHEMDAPAIEREIYFGGSYVNSRRIDRNVYTVVQFPEVVPDGLRYWPDDIPGQWAYYDYYSCWEYNDWAAALTPEHITSLFEDLRATNTALIEALDVTDLLPSITDVRWINGAPHAFDALPAGCGQFYLSQSNDGKSLLSIVTIKADMPWYLEATSILSRPGAVYASKENLYVAVRQYASEMAGLGWFFDGGKPGDEATTVHRFHLLPFGIGTWYAGSGVVPGRVLNQFSLDEHQGHLRIATTTGHLPSSSVHSTVSVLDVLPGKLELDGVVDDLAPGEDIRSVRFAGDTGYVVTFKKTDPLFVLDLSDPMAPYVRSELKIPGFSTYMHPIDAEHLLTIGYDADDQGSFAWFQGILLQIFDVGDPGNPMLVHKEVIGTRGTTSDAATNHLAFNYFAPKQLLAIPIVICQGGSGGTYGSQITFSGLLVYRVTPTDGFEILGGIPHPDPVTGLYSGSCSNWWTKSNSQVKRSVFMDDFVYSVALDVLDVSHLDDLEDVLVSVPLE